MSLGRLKVIGKFSSLISLQVPPQFLHYIFFTLFKHLVFSFSISLSLDYFFLSLSIFIHFRSSFYLIIMKLHLHYDSDVIYCDMSTVSLFIES